jgi:anti-sigma factor RsiW
MRCSKAKKYLSPYLDGELGVHEKALFETHLDECHKCASELERMRRLQGLFNQDLSFSAPSAFREIVMDRITAGQTKGLSLFPVLFRFAEVVVFVLAVTAGIMSGGVLTNAFIPREKEAHVLSSLSLDTFESAPPGSVGRVYLSMTEEKR